MGDSAHFLLLALTAKQGVSFADFGTVNCKENKSQVSFATSFWEFSWTRTKVIRRTTRRITRSCAS